MGRIGGAGIHACGQIVEETSGLQALRYMNPTYYRVDPLRKSRPFALQFAKSLAAILVGNLLYCC